MCAPSGGTLLAVGKTSRHTRAELPSLYGIIYLELLFGTPSSDLEHVELMAFNFGKVRDKDTQESERD